MNVYFHSSSLTFHNLFYDLKVGTKSEVGRRSPHLKCRQYENAFCRLVLGRPVILEPKVLTVDICIDNPVVPCSNPVSTVKLSLTQGSPGHRKPRRNLHQVDKVHTLLMHGASFSGQCEYVNIQSYQFPFCVVCFIPLCFTK